MDTFPCINADRRIVVRIVLAVGGWLIVSCGSLLEAGNVFVFGSGSGTEGKLTLNSAAIHVEGNSGSDINLPDVLEADFGEVPFQLNYFSSTSSPSQLPANLKGEDLGHPSIPGSYAYADAVVTLTSAGSGLQKAENDDKYFAFGQPWVGDGQLTFRVKGLEGGNAQTGPMLRVNLDPSSIFSAMGLSSKGGGLFLGRGAPGSHAGWTDFSSDMPPLWLRLTRSGSSLDFQTSSDGEKWEIISETNMKPLASSWLGIFLNSYFEKTVAKATLDQLTFAPVAAESDTLPPGVLLRSGSFLAGSFHLADAKGGSLDRNGKGVALNTAQIAAVILHPVTLHQIAEVAAQSGLIMKNGDFLTADIQGINGGFITVNSLLLGIVDYQDSDARVCVLRPVQPQPSDYEVRLKDGSIIRATTFNAGGGQIAVGEVSGASVDVSADEIAQVRAGLSRIQPLIALPWKATAPAAVAPTPAAAVATANSGASSSTNAPNTNAAPPAAVAPAPSPETNFGVQSWTGPNQEQILALPPGASLEFPLSGKFNALALRVGLATDAAPNAQVTVRILADGREIGRTPPFKSGSQLGFVTMTLLSPKTVTIVADANVAGTKTLLIDPVAVRQE